MKRDLPAYAGNVAPPSAEVRRRWQHALALLLVVLVWIVGWYGPTAKSMAEIWARSDTFAHGFVVVPIVAWLAWRLRRDIAVIAPQPAWWALAPIAIAGFAWLLGEVAAVNALSQLALVVLIVAAIVGVLGNAVSKRLAFPLAFLFFAVPIGEFLIPKLMAWTADFTVFALRLSGVPVYRTGLQFVIPSGAWSVVEACSGLRYLVASLMVGTLFAYLTYQSFRRRLIFIAAAIAVPIVANWVRAYLTVMLGHLSSNKLATGVDHLIYGWLFFGLVVGTKFLVGSRWREEPAPETARMPTRPTGQLTGGGSKGFVIAGALALAAVVWKIGYWAIEQNDAASDPVLSTLRDSGSWHVTASSGTWRPHFPSPSAEVSQTFQKGSEEVGLYIGYYRNQNQARKLVSSQNALVKSNDAEWNELTRGSRDVDLSGKSLPVRSVVLTRANGERMVVWQWYWINGWLTASDYWAKGYTALSRLLGRGDDSAVIVLYATDDHRSGGANALGSFLPLAAPQIETVLSNTRNAR
jgi:exosortase A